MTTDPKPTSIVSPYEATNVLLAVVTARDGIGPRDRADCQPVARSRTCRPDYGGSEGGPS
jgi:hypothetical protein